MATFHKTEKPQQYEVRQDGKTIGWFSRYYEPSTGRWAARYTGHFPGGYFWEFCPEDIDLPGFFNGVSFKKGKAQIMQDYPES
jgi:hypothetical protein